MSCDVSPVAMFLRIWVIKPEQLECQVQAVKQRALIPIYANNQYWLRHEGWMYNLGFLHLGSKICLL